MPKPVYQGRLIHRTRSLCTYLLIALTVAFRRTFGRPIVREWSMRFEIGTLFIRAQFNHAFSLRDINYGRAYFDSLYEAPDRPYEVTIKETGKNEPKGHWFIPKDCRSDATLLYFHGGGYTFYATVSFQFIAMLAETLGLRVFAPDYRLTPEHPHPAQIDDGLSAYRFLLNLGLDPASLIIAGDSAGGHLALMTLVKLREASLPQPTLGIALSPWTDIGRRGASQFGNDPYDLVQGYMTLQFAAWLKGSASFKGENEFSDRELSPIHQDFSGLAPIYLQAGGREILVDMIREFAHTIQSQGGHVRLDVWPQMNHEFHAYGKELVESREALARLGEAIAWATPASRQIAPAKYADFPICAMTEVDCLPVRASPER